MWTLITGRLSQLTSDVIQRREGQQSGAQPHSSLSTQLLFSKPSAGEKDSEY